MEKEPYNQIDHVHCWNQKVPACGIEKASHKVCCLCEKPMENKETNYCDSRTNEERERDSKIEVTMTTSSAPVVEKSGWEGTFMGILSDREDKMFQYYKSVFRDDYDFGYDASYDNDLKSFIKNVEKEAYERGKEHGKYLETVRRMTSDAKAIADYRNIPEDKAEVVLKSARLEGKKEAEQEIKERLTKILKAATGNSGTIAVTPEVIMSNLFPEE